MRVIYFIIFSSVIFAQEITKEIKEIIEEEKGKIKKEEVEEAGALKKPTEEGVPKGAPEAPSTIEQMFVETYPIGVTREIKQFGYDIFKGPATSFAPIENIPVPPDYVIGPDDEIVINVWGKIQETFNVKVDRNGEIILPKAGPLYVWGLTFEQAQKRIKETLQQYYTNLETNVSMGRLRTIRVFILGEVTRPGSYILSSLSTPFHAIYSAGGPTKLGSMRKIKITGKINENIDLYNILVYGKKESDYYLNSGDIIYVSPIGKVVGITGCVKRPAIYELKEEETLEDLINLAGGIIPIGYIKRIQIERIEAHSRRIIMDMKFETYDEFKSMCGKFNLCDGDLVIISPITPRRYGYVTIKGNVQRPGRYEIKDNLTIKDLIEQAEGLLPGTYLERAEIARYKADKTREIIPINLEKLFNGDTTQNIKLKEWDEVTIYAETDVYPEFIVEIRGAVRKPGKYKFTPNMNLEDLIFLSGGLLPTADLSSVDIYRQQENAPPIIENINMNDNNEIKLKPFDYVFIHERKEWTDLPKVTLKGEFVRPGEYIVSRDERLHDVIKRAGGWTKNAFIEGVVFTRQSVKEMQEKAIKEFIIQAQKEMYNELSKITESKLTDEERKRRMEMIEYRKKLIEYLSNVEVKGRVTIDLTSKKSNILLEDGDELYIPPIPTSVQVVGCVYNPIGVLYEEGKSISGYINQAGGLTEFADKNKIYVIKPSGRIEKGKNIKIGPGDCIVVPEKFEVKEPWRNIIRDVAQIMYQVGMGTAALYTIWRR